VFANAFCKAVVARFSIVSIASSSLITNIIQTSATHKNLSLNSKRITQQLISTGSGVSAQFYVKAYRECGSVYGRPSSSVLLNELINNDNPKACIVELKHISGKTMAEAKNIFSDLVNGNIVKLDFDSEDDAEKAIEKLSLIGIYAKLIWC
jgi:hypothetical protein